MRNSETILRYFLNFLSCAINTLNICSKARVLQISVSEKSLDSSSSDTDNDLK